MIQTETTPNPDSIKFLSENTISAAGTEEFQKIDIDKINNISGMDITFVTSTNDDSLAKSLLKELGLPFKKN